MSHLKVIVKELPRTTAKHFVDSRIEEYSRSGRDIKTEVKNDLIVLYYLEEMS